MNTGTFVARFCPLFPSLRPLWHFQNLPGAPFSTFQTPHSLLSCRFRFPNLASGCGYGERRSAPAGRGR